MVSAPGRGHCVVCLSKTLFSHSASLRPSVKWVPANLMPGGNPPMDRDPIRGGVEILATETDISSGLMRHLARMQTFTFYLPLQELLEHF